MALRLDIWEALCDLLDGGGKETLEVSVCREASEKSPRAFWAFRRLGYLQASGRAYQRFGMFTAAIKLNKTKGGTVFHDGVDIIYHYGVRAYPFTEERLEELKREEKERYESQTSVNLLTKP